MNGIHDLGGMDGMGPIVPEENEPVFHQPWERRMFALMISTFAGGQYNVDKFRHAIEKMDPAHYLESSYYEHWLAAVETNLLANGALEQGEIEARMAELAKEAS